MQQPLVLGEPIFVGRKTELDDLQKHLYSMLQGKGSTVLVSGVAGSGKTRLVNEFLNIAKDKNVSILLGWCLSSSNVPYFPFVEAFNSFLSPDQENTANGNLSYTVSKMASYLTERSPPQNDGPTHEPTLVWKDRTFLTVTKELLFLSASKPLVLILEDLHWADTASLALLHYMSRAMGSERIMIVGTFRNEELTSGEGSRPLASTLHLMGREALFKEIKLANLNKTNIGKIAKSMLGGFLDPALIQSISDESHGNPLFVVETIRMLSENGGLVRKQKTWQLKNKIGIPYRVREIILRRLEPLKPEERRILDVAAVIGDKFDGNLIASVLSIDSLIVLETLNKMFHTTFLLRLEDNVYTFDHAMTREVLYQEISKPLKIAYHQRIGQQMENKQDSGFSVNQLAFHYTQAGNNPKAIEYSILAGKDALARYSNTEAIQLFTWALQTINDTPENLETRKKVLEGLGEAFYANNAFKDAIKTYKTLAEISTRPIRQQALIKAMRAAFFQGDTHEIENLIKKEENEENLNQIEKARILHYKGVVETNLYGQIPEAIKLCEESLRIFEEEYALSDTAWLLFVVADFASGQGEVEKAIAYCLRSLAIYNGLGDLRSMMEAYNQAGKVFIYCGLYPEAQRMLEKVSTIEQETRMGNHIMLAKANCFLSLLLSATGDLKGATEKNFTAIEYSNKANSPLFLAMVYSNLVKQFVKLGKTAKALEYDAKLKTIFTPTETNRETILIFYYALAQAVLLAGLGKFKQASEQLEKYITIFHRKFSNPRLLNLLLSDYAWVLEKSGDKSNANTIREKITQTNSEWDQKFAKPNVKAYFITPIKVIAGETFHGRLDIINVSRGAFSIEMCSIVPSEIDVLEQSHTSKLNKTTLLLQETELQPFSVITVDFAMQAKKTGQFTITSIVKYKDEQGNTKMCETPINITVQTSNKEGEPKESNLNNLKEKSAAEFINQEPREGHFQFTSEVAEKVFNYLTKEFIKDYMQHRLAAEKAGWRSLIEISTNQKIPQSSLYGFKNHRGRAIVELERRGLVEVRFFTGERGRGGKIMRLRLSYEKDTIKRHVDNQIRSKKNQ